MLIFNHWWHTEELPDIDYEVAVTACHKRCGLVSEKLFFGLSSTQRAWIGKKRNPCF